MKKLVLEKGSTYSRHDLHEYLMTNGGILYETNRPMHGMLYPNQQLEIIEIYTEVGVSERTATYDMTHYTKDVVIIAKAI